MEPAPCGAEVESPSQGQLASEPTSREGKGKVNSAPVPPWKKKARLALAPIYKKTTSLPVVLAVVLSSDSTGPLNSFYCIFTEATEALRH